MENKVKKHIHLRCDFTSIFLHDFLISPLAYGVCRSSLETKPYIIVLIKQHPVMKKSKEEFMGCQP